MKIGSPRPQPAFPARRCALYLLAAAIVLDLTLGQAHGASATSALLPL
ncbi:hypothetical protein [Azoarcus sp. DD4]|nr:hypothetical protein [Azoarcus sp. DD4]